MEFAVQTRHKRYVSFIKEKKRNYQVGMNLVAKQTKKNKILYTILQTYSK